MLRCFVAVRRRIFNRPNEMRRSVRVAEARVDHGHAETLHFHHPCHRLTEVRFFWIGATCPPASERSAMVWDGLTQAIAAALKRHTIEEIKARGHDRLRHFTLDPSDYVACKPGSILEAAAV